MSSAELTAWARLDGLRKDALSKHLWDKRTLVKSWTLRGTLHLMPADEYDLWVGALSTYDYYRKPAWAKYFGVTPKELDRVLRAVGDVLTDEPVTREVLVSRIEKKLRSKDFGDVLRSGWGSLLKPASLQGRLCYGPSQGQNVTFVSPEEWLGRKLVLPEPDEALREVGRRFALLNGPVAREELSRWWYGITPARAGQILASLENFVPVDVEGQTRFIARKDVDAALSADATKEVHLLPAFDQYVVMSPRDPALLDPKMKERVFRKAAWLSPVLLVGGRIEGVWWWERKGKRLQVDLEPFTKQPAWVKKAASVEIHRLADLFGLEPVTRWARPVTSRRASIPPATDHAGRPPPRRRSPSLS